MAQLSLPWLRNMCKWSSRTGIGLWFPIFSFCSRCISSPFCQSDSLPQLSVVKAATNTKLTGKQSKILTEWTAWLFHNGRDCFHPLWNHWTSFGAIAIVLGNLSGHARFALHRGDCSGLFPYILSKHWHPCTWWAHLLVELVTVPIWSWFHCSSAPLSILLEVVF